jgi:general secretion pathway protein I
MDESTEGYDCAWKVQVVELPDPPLGEGVDTDGGLDLGSGSDAEGAGGPMAALMQLQQSVKTPGETPDLGALAGEFSGAMGGSDAIAGMMMGLVYPSLKPMLQASIRKVIVSVRWREGVKARTLDVPQYITDPQQAAVESEMARGALDQVSNSVFPGQGAGDTSSSSGSRVTGNTGPGSGTGSAARRGR